MINSVFLRDTGKFVLSVALAVLLVAAAAPSSSAGEKLTFGKGLLWKVEREGVEPSYVFGTMHVSDRRVTALPKQLVEVLTMVDSLSLEVIFHDRLVDGEEAWMFSEGRRLRDIIGKRMFHKIAKRLGLSGDAKKQLDRLKPWAVAMSFGPLTEESTRRDQGMIFLDHLLQFIAAERGARVFALESPKDQLDVFDGMPMRLQVDMLRHAMRHSKRGKGEMDRMVELYLKRDVEAILGMATGKELKIPEFARVLDRRMLDMRNKNMVERMMPRLTEGNALIAVGAAHLPGQVGILNLLADKGYQIARVY